MVRILNISPQEFNLKLASALKNMPEFKQPEWATFVKTSPHKQRPTQDTDFWYNRAASILRQVSIRGTVGVNRLRIRYGGRKDKGMKPPAFMQAGGKIIRLLLQQCEQAGLLEKSKGRKAGRQLTAEGKKLLESIN